MKSSLTGVGELVRGFDSFFLPLPSSVTDERPPLHRTGTRSTGRDAGLVTCSGGIKHFEGRLLRPRKRKRRTSQIPSGARPEYRTYDGDQTKVGQTPECR